MDGLALCSMRSFHQNFGKRRVCVNVARDLVRGEFHHVGEGELGEQLGYPALGEGL